MGTRYIIQRSYSAISAPPVRGFVLAIGVEDDDGSISVDSYRVVGVAVRTERRWEKQDNELGGTAEQELPLSPSELRAKGYRPEQVDSEIVPVILYSYSYGVPDDRTPPGSADLALLPECPISQDLHKVVWCSWNPEDDEIMLASAAEDLKVQWRASSSPPSR